MQRQERPIPLPLEEYAPRARARPTPRPPNVPRPPLRPRSPYAAGYAAMVEDHAQRHAQGGADTRSAHAIQAHFATARQLVISERSTESPPPSSDTSSYPLHGIHIEALTAVLKRVLPPAALAQSCRSLALEVAPIDAEPNVVWDGLRHLEAVAAEFNKAIAAELLARRDQLRWRESAIVSKWEDEFHALEEDDRVQREAVNRTLHRTATPDPLVDSSFTIHSSPYFVDRCKPSVPPSSPTNSDVDENEYYGEIFEANVLAAMNRGVTSNYPAQKRGKEDEDDDDQASMKVIASSFYRDLAHRVHVDPPLDRVLVRSLVDNQVPSGDLLNSCVDEIMATRRRL